MLLHLGIPTPNVRVRTLFPGHAQSSPSVAYGGGSTPVMSTSSSPLCPLLGHTLTSKLSSSWDAIRQTANVTDMELNERFRRTALYTVFQAASQDAGVVNFKLLTPADALVVPTTREIESRWPGMAPEQVEALEMDHLAECEKLAGLKLEDVIDRVKELATQDPIWT